MLATDVDVRSEAVVERRQLHNRPVVGKGELQV